MAIVFASPPTPPVAGIPETLTIVRGELIIAPMATAGYDSTRTAMTIVHAILGKPEPDITLRPATLRSGTLTFWFDSEQASRAAENAHAEGGIFSLQRPGLETVEMAYIATGEIARRLEPTVAKTWIVSVDFTEVAP